MILGLDGVILINVGLCLLIFLTGCIAYIKTKNKAPFQLGVAFGLFAIAHLINLMGLEKLFEATIALVRVFGYLIVLFVVYAVWLRK